MGVITDGTVDYDPVARVRRVISADVYSFGTVAMFSCNDGFDLVGSPLSTCEGLDVPTGEFTPDPPKCLRKYFYTINCKFVHGV